MTTIHTKTNLIAHRGLSKSHCENTLPAFVSACKSPFWGIETDIQFTKDQKIVCFHDKTLKRLSGDKRRICDLKLKELKKVKLCPAYGSGDKICTFKQYLKVCKKYKKQCVIELKYKMSPSQMKKVLQVIRRHRYTKNCTIISFDSFALSVIRHLCPTIKLQLLINNPLKRYIAFCKDYDVGVSLYSKIATRETIAKLISLNIAVGVWTINDLSTAQKFADQNVGYITTDNIM